MPGSQNTVEEWFAPGRFAFLAACLIVACFPGVIFGSETFFFRDYAIFSYPLADFHKDSFWRGEVPLWNPYNDCGIPFLAQWNTMVFYPLSIIYLLLPLAWSLSFFCLFHMFLAALGMYYLARAWSGSNFAGAIAGLGFAFGGVMLSCLKWPNNMAALGWMPWVVLFAERAFSGSSRSLGIAALVGATQMLAGAPEVILLTWSFVGLLFLAWLWTESGNRVRRIARFAGLMALVAGLAAVQLLPFLELLQHSQRDENFTGSQWPMPPWGWLNFIVPLFRMFPSYHGVHAQPGQYWISTYYTSLPLLLLAVAGVVRVRGRRVCVAGALLLIACWMALGERAGLYLWAREVVPGLGMMRFPIKFVVLASFLIPLLGALGLAQLLKEGERWRIPLLVGTGAILSAIIVTIVYSELNPFPSSRAFLTAWNGAGRALFLVIAVIGLGRLSRGSASKVAAVVLSLVVVLDGLTHATWHNPAVPRWVYSDSAVSMQPIPKLGHARAMISPEAANIVDHLNLPTPVQDVLASRAALYCNLNLLEEIPKTDGFFAIAPKHIADLNRRIYDSTNMPPAGILDFLGVTHVTRPGTWNEWLERPKTLPLVTSVPAFSTEDEVIEKLFSEEFDPRSLVFLESEKVDGVIGVARIENLNWGAEKISFETESDAPAVAVIAQTYFPAWKVTVNGVSAEILRANYAFQAVKVPAGDSVVVLEYDDLAFKIGGIVSVVCGLAATGLVIGWPRWMRAKARPSPGI